MRTRRIVVGVDGSDGSARALRWCADLAEDLDVEVIAVHSMEVPIYSTAAVGLPIVTVDGETMRESIRHMFEEAWCAPLERGGVKYRAEVVEGDPAKALMSVADGEAADMIVVGSRGRGGFSELVLGSVSHKISHHARQPVVIVPG